MRADATRDPVYFTCVVLLAAIALVFFALRPWLEPEILRIRSATALLGLLVALGLALRARGEMRPWAAWIGAIVVLACGVQLALFVIGARKLSFDADAQSVSQNFAAGMFCVGTALVLDGVLPARWGRHLVLGLLGAIVAGIGALGGFGLLAGALEGGDSAPLRAMRLPSVMILLFSGFALLAGARLRSQAIASSATSLAREPDDLRDRTGLAAGLAMLLVTLGATALTWRESKNYVERQEHALIERSLERLASAVAANALDPLALLDGLRGLFAASDAVEGAEWDRYLGSVHLEQRFPGVVAVGYLREVQSTTATEGGVNEVDVDGRAVRIWPSANRASYYPIVYITPKQASTQRLLGYDIGADPLHRETVAAAHDRGAAAVSARIDFAEFGDPKARSGYVIVTPVGRSEGHGESASAGFVYAAVDIASVVGKAADAAGSIGLSVRVSDEEAAETAPVLYADGDFDANAELRSSHIEVAGRSWNVSVQPRASVARTEASGVPFLTLVGGSICALVLFAITWVLAGHRARALHLAATMTSELRKSQRSQQAITDTANAGIITADSNGNILYMNPSAASSFGADAASMRGQSLTVLMPARLRDAHQAGLARVRGGGATRMIGHTVEMAGLHRDGSEFPIEILLSIWASEGQTFFTAFVRDITERRHAQLQLEQKTRELERSNADLEQFAYVASHDLQEPLRMVASYVQLLSRRYRGRLDSDADEFIGFAVDGATRMQRLIQDLLAYARVGRSGKLPIATHVGHCAESATADLQEAILESGARVHVDANCEVAAVPSQLIQLFQNLIANAMKFRDKAVPEIFIDAALEERFWHVRVRDNGIGIEPPHRERVFAIFQRLHTRKDYAGTGIGLAICRKIVEGFGGRIWVESQPGSGCVFHFTLPAMEPSA